MIPRTTSGGTVPAGLTRPVDHLVQSALTAHSHDQRAARGDGLAGEFGGVAGALGEDVVEVQPLRAEELLDRRPAPRRLAIG